MPRSFPRQLPAYVSLLVCAALQGCDNDAFAPPTRGGKTSENASTTQPTRAKLIAFIFPAEESDDLQVIENYARLEVGRLRSTYQVYHASKGDSSSTQAELIKRAIKDGASAIVLIADKLPETGEAISAVDQKKTPVVLLGRMPVSLKAGSSTLITWPNFAPSARQIVTATVEDVKKAGFPDDAPVLLLTNDPSDESSLARDAALTEAIKTTAHPIATKVPMVEDSVSSDALKNALKAHPKVCAVITDDGLGAAIATTIRQELKGAGIYVLSGYSQTSNTLKLVSMNQAAMIVDRNLEGAVRKAIDAAIERSEGKSVPDRIEVELISRRASGFTSSSLPQSKK